MATVPFLETTWRGGWHWREAVLVLVSGTAESGARLSSRHLPAAPGSRLPQLQALSQAHAAHKPPVPRTCRPPSVLKCVSQRCPRSLCTWPWVGHAVSGPCADGRTEAGTEESPGPGKQRRQLLTGLGLPDPTVVAGGT